MADEIVEELRRLAKDPKFMAGLEQAMREAQETINYLREAGRYKPERNFIVTI